MNILDDPILRQPSSKPRHKSAESQTHRHSSVHSGEGLYQEIPEVENDRAATQEDEHDAEEASYMQALNAKRKTREESSIMLNQTLASANNLSVLETSLNFTSSILAVKCKVHSISETA